MLSDTISAADTKQPDHKSHDKLAEKAAAALKKVQKALVDGGVAGTEGVAGDVLPLDFEASVELNVKFPAGKKVVVGKEVGIIYEEFQ